jgi:hypothetical protein
MENPKEPTPADQLREAEVRLARERRLKTSDAEVVEQYVGMMPLHVRAVMAEPLRPMFGALIQRERARCVDILRIIAGHLEAEVGQIENTITAAIGAGAPVAELAVQRAAKIAQALAVANCAKTIAVPPGSCNRCGGTKMVPSSIRLPGGQTPMLPCPACAGSPASAASSATASAAPAPSDPGIG